MQEKVLPSLLLAGAEPPPPPVNMLEFIRKRTCLETQSGCPEGLLVQVEQGQVSKIISTLELKGIL